MIELDCKMSKILDRKEIVLMCVVIFINGDSYVLFCEFCGGSFFYIWKSK